MASAARKSKKPRSTRPRPLTYKPRRNVTKELLRFVERCRRAGWHLDEIAVAVFALENERTLYRWLAEANPIPARVARIVWRARDARISPQWIKGAGVWGSIRRPARRR